MENLSARKGSWLATSYTYRYYIILHWILREDDRKWHENELEGGGRNLFQGIIKTFA
jgi:hypothetical protein